jgi:hypothetical protein
MKKFVPILVVVLLVLTVIGLSRFSSVWAGPSASGANAPLKVIKTVTTDGTYNIGGVCTVQIDYKVDGYKTVADAEVPVNDSKKVPFVPVKLPGYSDEFLLFPGCHFVNYKLDANKQYQVVEPMDVNDGTAKVCFGATPILSMEIYYYLDNPATGTKVWIPLPTTLEDQGRLICAPAQHNGVYMPSGKYVIDSSLIPGGTGENGGGETQGSVLPPPRHVVITEPGTYSVGAICTLQAEYKVKGLSDIVDVEFASQHLTEETLTVPPNEVKGVFYFPGCHVLHYMNAVLQDEMKPEQGSWRICFAAVPDKVMQIYYYKDNLTDITPPWTPLESVTENGKVCADLVDFTAVYAPAGDNPPPK